MYFLLKSIVLGLLEERANLYYAEPSRGLLELSRWWGASTMLGGEGRWWTLGGKVAFQPLVHFQPQHSTVFLCGKGEFGRSSIVIYHLALFDWFELINTESQKWATK